MSLTGPYIGVVAANADPAKLGRVKVNVPHVYGIADTSAGPIGVSDLPWAIPAGLPAGGSASSGGVDWLPDPGDQVLVFFLDGEPEKPVWMWLMQTIDQAGNFKLHHYSTPLGSGTPDRAGMTRYGHTFEINSGSVLASTKQGYQLLMLDGDPHAINGRITLQTPRANSLELDDQTNTATLNILQDCMFNIGFTWQSTFDDLDFESLTGDFLFNIGNDWIVDVLGNVNFTVEGDWTESVIGDKNIDVVGDWNLTGAATFNLDAVDSINLVFAALNLGAAASEPYVLGNRWKQMMNVLLVWLAGHTHSNGNNGSPTGPPLTPPQPEMQPLLELSLSTVIKGQ